MLVTEPADCWPCTLLPKLTSHELCHRGNSIMYIAKLNIQQGCYINWKVRTAILVALMIHQLSCLAAEFP